VDGHCCYQIAVNDCLKKIQEEAVLDTLQQGNLLI
jgi:hypothetical protein